MRYSLHKIDNHRVVATTLAADRDEALEWFSEKLRVMLTFEGDPVAADYVLHRKPHHSGFHSERSGCTPAGIKRRWMWSDRSLSSERRSQPGVGRPLWRAR
jgi:hypothetical protein